MQNSRSVAAAVTAALVAVVALILLIPGAARQSAVGPSANAGSAAPAPSTSAKASSDPRLRDAYRFERGGWIYLHLEGTPAQIGFQHGYLLSEEIADALAAYKLDSTHRTQRDWNFFRETSRKVLWPHIEQEYREELQAITEGARARGAQLDLDDVVSLNAAEEIPDYYVPWLDKREHVSNAPHLSSPGNCSAFVATGSYTRDGGIVMAHSAWTSYWMGERWRIVFDIVPAHGNHIFMDGFPGDITSNDDFGVNSAGIMITETTITQFHGFNPDAVPEFVRSRKALQYANSIDDYAAILIKDNNGGYANDWLLGDRKSGEIARLELGLENHRLWRTKDGYFEGSNFPSDPRLIEEETDFDPADAGSSPNARKTRWEQLLTENRGRIDVQAAQAFLSDHRDTFLGQTIADERTLCGHVEASPRGISQWDWGPHYPGGVVQGKAVDSRMAQSLSFVARMGHPCGSDFLAGPFLKEHPEYQWQAPILHDLKAGPWTEFHAGESATQ
jgi:Phospholipase B